MMISRQATDEVAHAFPSGTTEAVPRFELCSINVQLVKKHGELLDMHIVKIVGNQNGIKRESKTQN